MFLHIDDNEVFMRYCRFRGDIVVFLVYLVWDIVTDFKIVGVKKNGIFNLEVQLCSVFPM